MLDLDVSDGAGGAAAVANRGSADVNVEVVTTGGASAVPEESPAGTGLRLPAYADGDQRFAVVRVMPRAGDTSLDPGERDFVLSADLRLDPVSNGASVDNGDNLVQRGLYSGGQYKIQIDHSVPSCRVAGTDGEVLVEGEPVQADQWYRVECAREGQQVRLSVAPLSPAGPGAATTATGSGPLGSVEMAPEVPFSLGGKLNGEGGIVVSSSDQFNGSVARVQLRYPS